MHPSYEIDEWLDLQDQDPQERAFHDEVVRLMPYIRLLGCVYFLSEEEVTGLLQNNQPLPQAGKGELWRT